MADVKSNYTDMKSFFRMLFEDENYPYRRYFDLLMIGLIVLSISTLIMSKSHTIAPWLITFDLYGITIIFALEYLLRIWIHEDKKSHRGKYGYLYSKLRYMVSLPALIDFIAIFPKFRIIRLLKLYHYMHGASTLFEALLQKRFEFIFLGYMLLGITFTFGSLFYLLEFGINDALHSYLDALYWALITLSTVGYGDISPVTQMGKIVSMFGIIFGIAMISFVTSTMVSAFAERFDKLRHDQSVKIVDKMHDVVVIDGYSHLCRTIIKKLNLSTSCEAVIIESDENKAKRATQEGYRVIHGDGASASLIKRLYQKNNVIALLSLSSSDIENLYFILNAKSVNTHNIVYSLINRPNLKPQYKATHVNGVIEPYEVVEHKALEYLKKYESDAQKKIFFFGYTHKSRGIIEKLQVLKRSFILYEIDQKKIENAKSEGVKDICFFDIHNDEPFPLEEDIVVCAMDDDALNVYVSLTLRAKGFTGIIVALSDTKEDNRKLILSGVTMIFDMYEESATQFIKRIEQDKNKEVQA